MRSLVPFLKRVFPVLPCASCPFPLQSSQELLITLGKASPSLCRRVMQGLLQSRGMLSPELVVAMQPPGGAPRGHHRGAGPTSTSALAPELPYPRQAHRALSGRGGPGGESGPGLLGRGVAQPLLGCL